MVFAPGMSQGVGEEMICLSCCYLLPVFLQHLGFIAETPLWWKEALQAF